MARFSGRVDDRIDRFIDPPQQDRWVWDQKLVAILGHPRPVKSVTLQILLQHVVADERKLAADAFEAAVEQGHPIDVTCRLHAADGTLQQC